MIISPKKRATMHCMCVCVCDILPLCLTQDCTRWLELPGSLQSATPASLYFPFIVGADEAFRNEDQGVSDSTDLCEPTDRHAGKNIRTDAPWRQKGQSLPYESMIKQECIPVGCVPSARVAVSPGGSLPQCMLGYQPPWSRPLPDQAPPGTRHTPHGTRHPRQDQAPPWDQTPPRPGTPLPCGRSLEIFELTARSSTRSYIIKLI